MDDRGIEPNPVSFIEICISLPIELFLNFHQIEYTATFVVWTRIEISVIKEQQTLETLLAVNHQGLISFRVSREKYPWNRKTEQKGLDES